MRHMLLQWNSAPTHKQGFLIRSWFTISVLVHIIGSEIGRLGGRTGQPIEIDG